MADFLVYWKDYWRDVANDPQATAANWHTARESFYNVARAGDVLWVVVTGGKRKPKEWRLIQNIEVRKKFKNRRNERPFTFIGNRLNSRTFRVDPQPDFTKVLQALEFLSGKRISVKGRPIGKRLRLARRLSQKDSNLLTRYSRTLAHGVAKSESDELQENVKSGAGFGDAEKNREVEVAAVRTVRRHYQKNGWAVKSVERNRCGFDLICRKGRLEEHVEVKGIRGGRREFFITAKEVNCATNDPLFRLFAVTFALTNPSPKKFTGRQFLDQFGRTGLVFRASERK